jgi:Fe-S-cluster containining protein
MIAEFKTRPRREEVSKDANLCDYCTAKCCRYFALPIETPSSFADYEYMRWYLLHDRVSIFTEDGDWYLLVHTVCQHLETDNRCGIYETRPLICREYKTLDCEYDDDWTYEQYFETPEQMWEYAEAVMGPREGGIRSAKPALLPVIGI